jgi:hypothetical protein
MHLFYQDYQSVVRATRIEDTTIYIAMMTVALKQANSIEAMSATV